MTLPLLVFILTPGLLLYAALLRVFRLPHGLGLFAASWIFGTMLATEAMYLVCSAQLVARINILERTALTAVLLMSLALLVWAGIAVFTGMLDVRKAVRVASSRIELPTLVYIVGAIAFSYLFYDGSVVIQDGWLYHDYAYWDFTAHFPIIQNFVYGDNFPARSEIAAGLPMVYHFLHDLLVATYVALGASLPLAILLGSVLPMTALLVMVYCITEQLFRSRIAGVVAGMLIVTSCNLRWLLELLDPSTTPSIFAPFYMRVRAYDFAFVKCSLGKFNFTMFNVFYYLVERHLMFACAVLAALITLLSSIRVSTIRSAIVLSVLIANSVFWHSYLIPVMAIVVVCYALTQVSARLGIVICGVVGSISLMEVLRWRGMLHSTTWFAPIQGFPRLNFSFGMENEQVSLSLAKILEYWLLSWSGLLLCAAFGAVFLLRAKESRVWLLLPASVVTFILINTVQVMTTPVYENHKWVKPLQVLLAILAGGAVGQIAKSDSFLIKIATPFVIILLTISGAVEAGPFLRGSTMTKYAQYPEGGVSALRSNTKPTDVFVAEYTREVFLAGRKAYFTNRNDVAGVIPYLSGTGFRSAFRANYNHRFYDATTIEQFCRNVRVMKADVAEFSADKRMKRAFSLVKGWPSFTVYHERLKQTLVYVYTAPCAEISPNSQRAFPATPHPER